MPALSPLKPNFFVLGAPRCGTTALCQYLKDHPEVHFSDPKEPSFFHTDFGPLHRKCHTLEEYLRTFDPERMARAKAVGEGTVWYLYSREAVPNILAFNPGARFLVMVRDPIDLAHSLHALLLWGGEENEPSFERAWRLQEARSLGRSVPGTATDLKPLLYGDVASLGAQLERLFSLVPRERVLVVTYDDFRDDPAEEYSLVLGFLGLAPDERTAFPRVNKHQRLTFPVAARPLHWARMLKLNLGIRRSLGIWRLASSLLSRPDHRPALDPELREEMAEFFRDDVQKLASLLGRDLSHWARASEDEGRQRLKISAARR